MGSTGTAPADGQASDSSRQLDRTIWEELKSPLSGESEIAFPFVESELRTEVKYRLWGVVGEGNAETRRQQGNAFSTEFEASTLAALPRGMVFAESSGDDEAVSLRRFEEFAADFCA
mgnify:FL=1